VSRNRGAGLVRGDALHIPLADESVDLIVTSPPYFALRSYRDCGHHYRGQIGSEATPQAFLEALWSVMGECWRVLKPTGSCWVNLGDKRAGSGGHNNAGISAKSTLSGNGHVGGVGHRGDQKIKATRRSAPDRYTQTHLGRVKGKQLLPHRFAIGCADGLADPDGVGWIVRQDQVWSKVNGLPESVSDRTRDAHEYWFHLTKEPRYFAAVDEIRETHAGTTHAQAPRTMTSGNGQTHRVGGTDGAALNPLGKLPGSVWSVPSEPLIVPEHLGVDHFAAFPTEWPRRLILGWSPPGICTACGEPRQAMVARTLDVDHVQGRSRSGRMDMTDRFAGAGENNGVHSRSGVVVGTNVATITGYACACPDTAAPTRPAVVLDPFAGTGTVPMVARTLGRYGVGLDLSADYLRLAAWRIWESGHGRKAEARTNRERQGALFGGAA
jgi:DNA modification methylase